MSRDKRIIGTPTRRQQSPSRCISLGRWIPAALLLAAVATPQIGRAESVPLRFDKFTPATNVANMNNELGPGYTGGLTMEFKNVASSEGTTIDARVTATVRPGTEFATGGTNKAARGFVPNYKATSPETPNGDLGFLYAGANHDTAGISLTIEFFDGTGDRSGTFTESYVVSDLKLLVYDVDGEPTQSEWFEASYVDGLYSHATGSAPASVAAAPTASGVRFVGPGKDVSETDTSGAVLLRYRNTSRITLKFAAEQYSDRMNPVFSAIDGDLDLPVTGTFQPPTVAPAAAPEPAPAPAPATDPIPSVSRTYPADEAIRLERIAPAEVPLNVPFEYTLRLTNVTRTALHDVVVVEQLPKNFNLQGTDPQAEKTGETLSWSIGSLDPNAVREIKISGVAATAEPLRPCATLSFVVPPICGDIAVVEPKLTFVMVAAKEVLVCDPIELQFSVTNQGTGAAKDVKIVQTLPEGLKTLDGKADLVLDLGTLAPGESRQVARSIRADKTGEYVNKAVVTSGGLTSEATATTLVRQPVLAIAKTGPAKQYIGRPTTYEITVANKGDAPAARATIEDMIPQGARDIQTTPAATIVGSKATWHLGTLDVNDTRKVAITFRPMGVEPLSLTATASAVCAEPASAKAETAMYGIAAVLLEVIDTDDPVQVGGLTTYIITATNQGSKPSSNMQITAFVEDTGQIVDTEGITPITVEGNIARSAPLASLAPQAKAMWKITVKAVKPGDVRFQASMSTADLGRNVEETEATQFYE
ncbi:MAG: hypothetical protein ABFE01_20290 [Phycisphaerales bacterium]